MPTLIPPTHALAAADEKMLRRWTLFLLLLGLAWRLGRYATNRPIWGDEAALDLNLMNRGLAGMLLPLDNQQVAPPLFLILEWTVQHLLGGVEYAVRLLPLLAGLTAAVLFWRWCRLMVPPMAAALATALFAVGFYPMRYSVELKPYAFDQLAAVGMLYLAALWLRRPGRVRYGWLLALVMPAAILGSYPAVFVAGGLCAALLPTAWRGRSAAGWGAWAAMGLATVGTFLVVLTLVAQGQYERTSVFMDDYWVKGFPPPDFWGYVRWLIVAHTGDTFAYPQGGSEGGSTGTFLVFAVGALALMRQRRWQLLALLLFPFTLTFMAAALHRYPYGGGPRLAQHLAPAICLLTGYGGQRLLEWIKNAAAQRFAAGAALVALTLFGLIAFGVDLAIPYKTVEAMVVRDTVREVFAGTDGRVPVLVMQPMARVPMAFQLYLRWQKQPVVWDAAASWCDTGASEVVVLNFDKKLTATEIATLAPSLAGVWTMYRPAVEKELAVGAIQEGPVYYQATYWRREHLASK